LQVRKPTSAVHIQYASICNWSTKHIYLPGRLSLFWNGTMIRAPWGGRRGVIWCKLRLFDLLILEKFEALLTIFGTTW